VSCKNYHQDASLAGWLAGWLAGIEQAESISPAAASQSPRRAQNLAGTRAAYVTIFSPLSFVFAARPFCFYPMLYHIREGGELKADTPRT
jgi:hypothetical protein